MTHNAIRLLRCTISTNKLLLSTSLSLVVSNSPRFLARRFSVRLVCSKVLRRIAIFKVLSKSKVKVPFINVFQVSYTLTLSIEIKLEKSSHLISMKLDRKIQEMFVV